MSAPSDEQRIALRMLELEDRSRLLEAVVLVLRSCSTRGHAQVAWSASDVAAELEVLLGAWGIRGGEALSRAVKRSAG